MFRHHLLELGVLSNFDSIFTNDFDCEWSLTDNESFFIELRHLRDDSDALFFSHILPNKEKNTLVSRVFMILLVKTQHIREQLCSIRTTIWNNQANKVLVHYLQILPKGTVTLYDLFWLFPALLVSDM